MGPGDPQTHQTIIILMHVMTKAYLSNKTFKGGELVHGNGHLAHVVGHVRRAAQ